MKQYYVRFSVDEPYLERYITSTNVYAKDPEQAKNCIKERYQERGIVSVLIVEKRSKNVPSNNCNIEG